MLVFTKETCIKRTTITAKFVLHYLKLQIQLHQLKLTHIANWLLKFFQAKFVKHTCEKNSFKFNGLKFTTSLSSLQFSYKRVVSK